LGHHALPQQSPEQVDDAWLALEVMLPVEQLKQVEGLDTAGWWTSQEQAAPRMDLGQQLGVHADSKYLE
jgi:hypothetical protein